MPRQSVPQASAHRSLVTVSGPAALHRIEQLDCGLGVAPDNGLSVAEPSEAITHPAFHASRPAAMTAITQLEKIAAERST
ncbi:hypothetical protein [Streptomyces sp. NPDC058295]|uniref:hypothetical protein n=1 Tax=Streptomyces sp. NPDC058295 TaxID=3346431 RepID=UPI0036EFF887